MDFVRRLGGTLGITFSWDTCACGNFLFGLGLLATLSLLVVFLLCPLCVN
jgi:hypothetical protein